MARGLPEHLQKRKIGPNGKPGCRFCGNNLPGRRTSYCSDSCKHEFRLLNEPTYAKEHVFNRDKGICAICGIHLADNIPRHHFRKIRASFECDHIVELARGGSNDLGNLQSLCAVCHAKKTKQFAADRAFERRENLAVGDPVVFLGLIYFPR